MNAPATSISEATTTCAPPPPPPVDVKGLWKRYGKEMSGSLVENELVQLYLPLVKTVVAVFGFTR